MGYVIAGIVVLLIVAVAIAWLVMSATSRRQQPTAIVASDETPMGDSAEHAGEQSESGETVSDPESAERGMDPSGGDRPEGGGGPRRPERPEDRQMRDSGAPRPRSERLADRPR